MSGPTLPPGSILSRNARVSVLVHYFVNVGTRKCSFVSVVLDIFNGYMDELRLLHMDLDLKDKS